MTYFLWNVLLAFVWATLTGEFTLGTVAVGFVVGYGILWLSQRVVGPSRYFLRGRQLVGFALYYLHELVLANLRVARDVLAPRYSMRPAIIAIPLAARQAIGGSGSFAAAIIILAVAGGVILARFGDRIEGWRLSLIVLGLFVLFSVVR